jgi:hypothetical protein
MKVALRKVISVTILVAVFFSAFVIPGIAQSKPPAGNFYLSSEGENDLFFGASSQKPILNDLSLRKAIEYCSN